MDASGDSPPPITTNELCHERCYAVYATAAFTRGDFISTVKHCAADNRRFPVSYQMGDKNAEAWEHLMGVDEGF